MLKKAQKYLNEYFGHISFREGQEKIIDSILSGKDTLGIMPTGGGKSFCYQIPALCFEGLTVVISPLISLMKDQLDTLHTKEYPAEALNSTVSFERQLYIKDLVEKNSIKLLYLTPERFKNKKFTDWLTAVNISCFVIDEAHCISEWGHDFRPEYRELSGIIKAMDSPPILALTATATPEVQNDIISSLNMRDPGIFVTGFNRDNLIYSVESFFSKQEKNKSLLDYINKTPSPGIVYCSSVKDTDMVSNYLKTNSRKNIGVYHASLNAQKRKNMQEDFISGKIDVLAATNAFGMGIDKNNIRFVVHYSIPGSIEAYYQETGRAGRDGLMSHCKLFLYENDISIQRFFIDSKNPDLDAIVDIYEVLKKSLFKGPVYADALEDLFTKKKYNDFILSTVIKQLRSMKVIEVEYIPLESIELEILSDNIKDANRYFLEELITGSIGSGKTYTSKIDILIKRTGLNRNEIDEKLKLISEKRLIKYNIIKKGQVLRSIKKEISANLKKQYLEKKAKKIKIDNAKLDAMIAFCKLTTCRRKFILNYFGEKYHEPNCHKCDICNGTHETGGSLEPNHIQEKILLFLVYHDGAIGKMKALKILKGSLDIENKYRTWDEYGMLRKYDMRDIEGEMHSLIKNGVIGIDNGQYAVLRLTAKGIDLIKSLNTGKKK